MVYIWKTISAVICLASAVFCACPDQWSHHDDKCFFLSRENETYSDAWTFCQLFGRQYGRSVSLARVNDNSTQAFINTLMAKKSSNVYWIGLTDLIKENTFVWVANGQEYTFKNWGPQQPNNRNNNEHCVVILNSPSENFFYMWTDQPCRNLHPYICEMPAADIGGILG